MEYEAEAALDELAHLTMLVHLGSEEDGDAVDGRLQRIVYALAEASPDPGVAPIAVDGGEQPEAVDDEAVVVPRRSRLQLAVADRGTGELGLNGLEVLLVDLVGGDDELVLRSEAVGVGARCCPRRVPCPLGQLPRGSLGLRWRSR